MAKPTARARAEARMRELFGELKLITAAFPDIHDVFEDDDLPIGFIIRRDAAKVAKRVPAAKTPAPVRPTRSVPRAKPARRRVKT